jgi:hypothetical protein
VNLSAEMPGFFSKFVEWALPITSGKVSLKTPQNDELVYAIENEGKIEDENENEQPEFDAEEYISKHFMIVTENGEVFSREFEAKLAEIPNVYYHRLHIGRDKISIGILAVNSYEEALSAILSKIPELEPVLEIHWKHAIVHEH